MKKQLQYIFLVLVAMNIGKVQGQQMPLYSQYFYNPFLYNPAYAGNKGGIQAFLINRNQWGGIPGAPVTRAITVDGAIEQDKAGLGVSLWQDQTDIFSRMGVNASYSYQVNIAEDHSISAGLAVGALTQNIDFTKVVVRDTRDKLLGVQYLSRTSFDANLGVRYKWNDLEVGVSVPQLFSQNMKFYYNTNNTNDNQNVNFKQGRHYIATARYDFALMGGNLEVSPLLFSQFSSGSPVQIDAGAMATYEEKYMVNVMYRHGQAISMGLAAKVHERLLVGYSYDVSTSAISPYVGGSHEIIVGITFGGMSKKDKVIIDKLDSSVTKIEKKVDSLEKVNKELKKESDSLKIRQDELEEKVNDDFENLKRDLMDPDTSRTGSDPLVDELRKKLLEGGVIGDARDGRDGRDGTASTGGGRTGGPKPESYVLQNIYFAPTNGEVLPSSYDQLNQLSELLLKNPTTVVEISGFADNSGSLRLNQRVSKDRADAVKRYLVAQGVKSSQITTKGRGVEKPLGNNNTYDGRKMNRRVEIKIISR